MSLPTTTRVVLTVGTQQFSYFTGVSVQRDLDQLSGRFRLQCLDVARADAALGGPRQVPTPLLNGAPATVAIDGETVLAGYIGRVDLTADAERLNCTVGGLDRAGDLVRGAAFPKGPAEFHSIGLMAFAQKVCAPFGIYVKADVGLGAPFTLLSTRPEQTGRDVLDMAARQRSVLVTSDGLGGVVLTQGGITRAPAPLWFGQNVESLTCSDDWSDRFSDYFVKGQTPGANGARTATAPAITHASAPTGDATTENPGTAFDIEAQGVMMTGHAIDPQITRWLPTVRRPRSQSGSSSVQEQAEWMLRTSRGKSLQLHYRVLDWRDPASAVLWRPNQVTAVYDPYSGINGDMLIAGVDYQFSARGRTTMLRVVPQGTYDLLATADPVGSRIRDQHAAARGGSTS